MNSGSPATIMISFLGQIAVTDQSESHQGLKGFEMPTWLLNTMKYQFQDD